MTAHTSHHFFLKPLIATTVAALCMVCATSAFAQAKPCHDSAQQESAQEQFWNCDGASHTPPSHSRAVHSEPSFMDTHGQVVGGVAGGAIGAAGGLVIGIVLASLAGPDSLGTTAGIPLLGIVGGGYGGAFVGSTLAQRMSNVQRAPKGVAQPTGFNFKLSF